MADTVSPNEVLLAQALLDQAERAAAEPSDQSYFHSDEETHESGAVAAAYMRKPGTRAIVRWETARLLIHQREATARWRWFRRRRLMRVLCALEKEELAFRADGSTDR